MNRSFKEFVLEEGELFDAIKHGFTIGLKAFLEKRQEQTKEKEPEILTKKILSAEGKELDGLIKQIVNNGYTIKQGNVVKPYKVVKATDWLMECTTNTSKESSYEKLSPRICQLFSN